ncbi:MAG TPA: S9 family peptidase [Steroidobacteraceae bacterium]|nr:S9 family peptidase [Steroidobacteraceae bacterium]
MKHLLLSLFIIAGFSTANGVAQQLPIAQFTKHDEFNALRLSPTGQYLSYMTGKYGRTSIAFFDLKAQKFTGGIRCPDGFEIHDYHWVSNTRIVYRIAERNQDLIEPTLTGEMLAVDFDGGKQEMIYGYRASEQKTGTKLRTREATFATARLVSGLKGDDKNILIAEYPWRETASYWQENPDAKPILARLNTQDGSKRRLGEVPLASADVLVDHDDNVRFGIGYKSQSELAVVWRATPDAPWSEFALPNFRRESVQPLAFSENNAAVFFTGVSQGESLVSLFSVELATKAVTKVHGFSDSDISDVIYDFAGTNVIGVVGGLNEQEIHWIDTDNRAGKIHRALLQAFPKQVVSIISTTTDGKSAVVLVSSDVNPGDYYLFDTTTMKADYLRAAKSWIAPEKMRPKDAFTMKARDGLQLHGYVTRPDGTGPFPLVVLPHGGPHGIRDDQSFDWEVQLLASRGYAVLQLNFRGSGGYGWDFEAAGHEQWGAKMQDDLTDATRWAIDNKVTDASRICIFGASYGGYAALMGTVREPKLYRCAIGYVGVYDLELMLTSADIPGSRVGRALLQLYLGTDRESMRARSPVHNAQKIEVPILLIHGKEDWRADYEQVTRMRDALKKNNKNFELIPLRGEGHGIYDEETRREVYERVLAFLDKNLKN